MGMPGNCYNALIYIPNTLLYSLIRLINNISCTSFRTLSSSIVGWHSLVTIKNNEVIQLLTKPIIFDVRIFIYFVSVFIYRLDTFDIVMLYEFTT